MERLNHNHAAEGEIGHLKKRFCQNMMSKNPPKHLWDCGIVHQAGILIRIARGKKGQTGVEEVTVQNPDI